MELFKTLRPNTFVYTLNPGAKLKDGTIPPGYLGLNIPDGTVSASDKDGKIHSLDKSEAINTSDYIGKGRPLLTPTSKETHINAGQTENLTDIVNHLYNHVTQYQPKPDTKIMDTIHTAAGKKVKIEALNAPKAGLNNLRVSYFNHLTGENTVREYEYELPSDMGAFNEMRIRLSTIQGVTELSTLSDLVETDGPINFDPNTFAANGAGLWLVEIVHDLADLPYDYDGGYFAAELKVELAPYE